MLFAIHAMDHKGGLPKRLENYAAHRAFLERTADYGVKIVVSGPLTEDDGETMIGSLMIVEAPDREAAERWNANDPFHKAGLWEKVAITAYIKRQDNR
jgi:uncharacterized protein